MLQLMLMNARAQRIICSQKMLSCNVVKGDHLLKCLTEQAEVVYSNQ